LQKVAALEYHGVPGEPISANIPSIPAGEYMNSMRAVLSPALLK
jgi:hypothetical protein